MINTISRHKQFMSDTPIWDNSVNFLQSTGSFSQGGGNASFGGRYSDQGDRCPEVRPQPWVTERTRKGERDER